MTNGFSFDFIASDNKQSPISQKDETVPEDLAHQDSEFLWQEDAECIFQHCIDNIQSIPYEEVDISTRDGNSDCASGSAVKKLRAVNKQSFGSKFQNSDLVSGEYEGGLKVWECSIDLCRYFESNKLNLQGRILELGCGHGLPGCWALQQAYFRSPDSPTTVTFSDFNDFVIKDVTIPNILLNTTHHPAQVDATNKWIQWLSLHAVLGAGDWMAMSAQLLNGHPISPKMRLMIPSDGKYDVILAAETTYSTKAAEETAALIARHLRVSSGTAYVATKRYYFGVGGGSDAFRSAMQRIIPVDMNAEMQVLEVYDNGSGNIREILSVRLINK